MPLSSSSNDYPVDAWSAAMCPAPDLRLSTLTSRAVSAEHAEEFRVALRELLPEEGEADVVDVLRTYGTNLLPVVIPGLVVALLVLVCCLPLWIARCRAHKCCTPGDFYGPRRSTRLMANGCFPVLSLCILVACAIGVVAISDLSPAGQATACAADQLLNDTAGLVGVAESSLNTLASSFGQANTSAQTFSETLSSLSSGAVRTCDTLGDINATIAGLKAYLPADDYADLIGRLQPAKDVCDDLNEDVLPALDSAATALVSVDDALAAAAEALDAAEDFVAEAADAIGDYGGATVGGYTVGSLLNLAWPTPDGPPPPSDLPAGLSDISLNLACFLVGLVLFILPLVLVTLSLLVAAPAAAFTKDKRRCCCAGCGVQLLGLSWVCAGIVAFALFIAGALLIAATTATNDALVVVRGLTADGPTDFTSTFNGTSVCGVLGSAPPTIQLPEGLDLATLGSLADDLLPPASRRLSESTTASADASCWLADAVLETCWSSDAGGLLDVLLSTFGLPFSIATIRANITALNETLGEVDVTQGFNISEASVVDDFGDYLADKEPADFGLPCPAEGQSGNDYCADDNTCDGADECWCGTGFACVTNNFVPALSCDNRYSNNVIPAYGKTAEQMCDEVRGTIAELQTDAADVSSEVATLTETFNAASSNLRALTGSLVAALDGAVDDALLLSDCTWVSTDVDAALDSLETVSATLYVAGGFGFLLCAALLFLYMPSAIAVQIVHGGVGKQPGCPTFCRSVACCGAGHGPGASVQDADMDGTMVIDMDGAPQKSSLRASSQRL